MLALRVATVWCCRATVKVEDLFAYDEKTKAKFGSANVKRKGFAEAMQEIEESPDMEVGGGCSSSFVDVGLLEPGIFIEIAGTPLGNAVLCGRLSSLH